MYIFICTSKLHSYLLPFEILDKKFIHAYMFAISENQFNELFFEHECIRLARIECMLFDSPCTEITKFVLLGNLYGI